MRITGLTCSHKNEKENFEEQGHVGKVAALALLMIATVALISRISPRIGALTQGRQRHICALMLGLNIALIALDAHKNRSFDLKLAPILGIAGAAFGLGGYLSLQQVGLVALAIPATKVIMYNGYQCIIGCTLAMNSF